jgi:hypothetical protein
MPVPWRMNSSSIELEIWVNLSACLIGRVTDVKQPPNVTRNRSPKWLRELALRPADPISRRYSFVRVA